MAAFLEVDVVVEVPKGSRNKFERDPVVNAIRLDRELFTVTRYPADYGFVVATLGGDGDPLDALVLLGEPTFSGCHIFCRPLGVFRMSDEHGPDAKLLMVPRPRPRSCAAKPGRRLVSPRRRRARTAPRPSALARGDAQLAAATAWVTSGSSLMTRGRAASALRSPRIKRLITRRWISAVPSQI